MRLIDADGAIQKVDEAFAQYVDHGDALELFSDVRMAVLLAPTIEAEPVVHARWEWRGGIPWCTHCGEMLSGYSYEGDANTTPYCSNCGAKMQGGNDHD